MTALCQVSLISITFSIVVNKPHSHNHKLMILPVFQRSIHAHSPLEKKHWLTQLFLCLVRSSRLRLTYFSNFRFTFAVRVKSLIWVRINFYGSVIQGATSFGNTLFCLLAINWLVASEFSGQSPVHPHRQPEPTTPPAISIRR
jgi:hypothetical protein